MQAVILAGGPSERLRPMTHVTAKLMLKVAGKPYLEHRILSLKEQGITDIVILVSQFGDQVKKYFGSEFQGVSIKYSDDEMLGNGGAIKKALPLLQDEFIVINGDTFAPITLRDLVNEFRKSGCMCTITVCRNSNPSIRNNVFLDGSRVVAYSKNGSFPYVDVGMTVVKKSAFDLTDKNAFSFEEEIYQKLASMNQISAFEINGRFFDIHTMLSYENIRSVMQSR